MAMTNKERQQRWLKKNRALHNLRRRNARKDKSAVLMLADPDVKLTLQSPKLASEGEARESTVPLQGTRGIQTPDSRGGTLPFETKKVGEFRMLVIPEEEKIVLEPVKPRIFTDDSGRVITERAWNILQERKRRAKEGGYSVDDYSQG